MRRFDVLDITEQHYRTLRLLIRLGVAEAHIVVKCGRPWPLPISYSPREPAPNIRGDAIN